MRSNLIDFEFTCPSCKSGEVQSYVRTNCEGNYEGMCDNCAKEFGFHCLIEIDGVHCLTHEEGEQ